MQPSHTYGWTLYSPEAPAETEAPEWGESLDVRNDEQTAEGFHKGGWPLPESAIQGWQFGVSQSRISSGRLHAFVRLPSGEEASLIWHRNVRDIEKLKVSVEPGYVGAFLINFASEPTSRSTLVAALIGALPKIQHAIINGSGATDA